MADFMDGEAVETSEEEMSEDESRAKVKSPSSSKKRSSKMISSDEEEDDDDEEKAKEEMKGFIAVSSVKIANDISTNKFTIQYSLLNSRVISIPKFVLRNIDLG